MPEPWSEAEIEAIVEDYFDMLVAELKGEAYNKAKHRRLLIPKLRSRSENSVERKHQNISAILIEVGLPYISGYKPLGNYQRALLPEAVLAYVIDHPGIEKLIAEQVSSEPAVPDVDDILKALVSPPTPTAGRSIGETESPCRPRPVNYLAREAANSVLGRAGEEFVLNFERARLIAKGKDKLAEKVEHVSVTCGDGAGFDVRSYNLQGTERFIEVKTTRYGIDTPFFITPNEVRFSDAHAGNYQLYRVFHFERIPKLFCRPGRVRDHWALSPSQYIAML